MQAEHLSLDNTLGASLVGLILSAVVFGVTCLQVYEYYTDNCSRDKGLLRLLVACVWLLDLLHLAIISHVVYFFLVTHFGDPERLLRVVWSLDIQIGVAQIVAFVVQPFFAFRIYTFSDRRNWWLPALILLCELGEAAATIGFMVIGFRVQLFSQSHHNVPWMVGGITAKLTGNTLLTGGMTYYLLRARTGFESTNRVITLLITYSLNTGFLTAIFTVLTLALFVSNGQTTMLYNPFFFILARLYPCAFVSTLNSRKRLREALAVQLNPPDSPQLPQSGQNIVGSDISFMDVSSAKERV